MNSAPFLSLLQGFDLSTKFYGFLCHWTLSLGGGGGGGEGDDDDSDVIGVGGESNGDDVVNQLHSDCLVTKSPMRIKNSKDLVH